MFYLTKYYFLISYFVLLSAYMNDNADLECLKCLQNASIVYFDRW